MFDPTMDGWTYGPLIFIAILYILWRFLKPNRKNRDSRNRDFKTRYSERKKQSSSPTLNEELNQRRTTNRRKRDN